MLKDPLVRRFISASFFAGAFVWVAVRYFNVEADVVWVLFLLSFAFVGGLIVVGLFLAPLVRLIRRDPPFLANIDLSEDAPDAADKTDTAPRDQGAS